MTPADREIIVSESKSLLGPDVVTRRVLETVRIITSDRELFEFTAFWILSE